jgi:hypothetical protein
MDKDADGKEKIDPNFKIPDSSIKEIENVATQNIAFEKFKISCL